MSRVGKKPVAVPEKTEINISDGVITVKGPLGELKKSFRPVVDIKVEDSQVIVTPLNEDIKTKALWGTYASHIKNMVDGVNKEYEKKLIIEGVGYKAEVKGSDLVLNIGFSHQVFVPIPEGIKCTVEKSDIGILGIDKEVVGQFAAVVRSQKKPEPYKGKGIRYSDEIIRRKEGKKAV
ncbi:MAG: large subunit ribosomal protein L6 [Candidatus Paceibacteria bacterium]|jgi:large subunit ribosomal protein L6